jgi:hypothetical protein
MAEQECQKKSLLPASFGCGLGVRGLLSPTCDQPYRSCCCHHALPRVTAMANTGSCAWRQYLGFLAEAGTAFQWPGLRIAPIHESLWHPRVVAGFLMSVKGGRMDVSARTGTRTASE